MESSPDSCWTSHPPKRNDDPFNLESNGVSNLFRVEEDELSGQENRVFIGCDAVLEVLWGSIAKQ